MLHYAKNDTETQKLLSRVIRLNEFSPIAPLRGVIWKNVRLITHFPGIRWKNVHLTTRFGGVRLNLSV
jgi:hypothetical protein